MWEGERGPENLYMRWGVFIRAPVFKNNLKKFLVLSFERDWKQGVDLAPRSCFLNSIPHEQEPEFPGDVGDSRHGMGKFKVSMETSGARKPGRIQRLMNTFMKDTGS